MAIDKNIELKISADASQAEKAFAKFGQTLKDVKDTEVEPLNFAIGELEDQLYEMAAAGQQNTALFKKMSKEVGKMKKVIIDTDLAVDGMSQSMAQNMGGALSGVAGGFELAQGAMGAFGVSGEAVEESLLKVQSAMAMAQGIQGLKEGMAAFKGLRSSIMATTVVQKVFNLVASMNPIGLLIAGIVAFGAALAALWGPISQFRDWVLGIEEAEETAGEARKRRAEEEQTRTKAIRREHELSEKARKRAFDAEQSAMDNQIRLLQAQGKDVTALRKTKTAAAIQNLQETLKNIEAQYDYIEAIVETDKASGKWIKALEGGQKEVRASNKTAVAEMKSEIENLETDLKLIDIEAGKRGKERADEAIANNKEKLDKIAEQEAEARKKAYELDKQVSERVAAQKELMRSLNATDNENELRALQDSYTAKFELAKGDFNLTIALLKEKADAEEALALDQAARLKAIEDQAVVDASAAAKEKSDIEASAGEQRFSIASGTFSAIGDLANAFAGDSEKEQKRAFKINKAAQLANALMSTYQSAQGAYASQISIPTPDAPIRAAIAAGVAVASGLANVASIAKTKFQGGGSSGGGGGSRPSAPSLPSGGSPTFNVIGDSGTNQIAESLGQPQKAYVVSSEVTSAQSLDRNKIENASI